MTHHKTTPGVVGRCFVLTCRDDYIGCVSVQQHQFYSTVCATHNDAVLQARKLAATLHAEHVFAECVCQCLPKASDPDWP